MNMQRGGRAAVAGLALLSFAFAGCSDEDGDGATTDEEVDELDQEVDEGTNEAED